MASQDHIRNPIEWGWDQISLAALTVAVLAALVPLSAAADMTAIHN